MSNRPHSTQEIRKKFVDYFKKQNHAHVASSSVVPHQDPTLLFINAGMNQFKDVFLGKATRDYTRAVTCQKCIRGGGKHNDLENVGHTTRHLTFFEMLGNFSFGDYFKRDAIKFAWEVSTEVFGFDADKIWPTIFREDDEAFELWRQIVPENRITRMDEADNFWAMGDTGPCGPCSELLFDRGDKFGSAKRPSEDKSGERFLEFWNLVFMQYNRFSDGSMQPLPKQSIDTGAGLERVVSLKLGVNTLFATDVLRDLIAGVEELSGIRYENEEFPLAPAFHVIADHLRSLSFAIADGAQPSNVDRGYVLRKILRRAVRYGRQLKFEEPFLAKLLPRLIGSMGETYEELSSAKNRIEEILTLEEEAFFRTLKRGGNLLNQVITSAKSHKNIISGDDAFKLKDTYGLPIDEIQLMATDNALSIDTDRFAKLEQEAKERSRSARSVASDATTSTIYQELAASGIATQFEGYAETKLEAKVIAIVVDGKSVQKIGLGETGIIILDKTPFYAEKGGQVGDIGMIVSPKGFFNVTDCTSPQNGITAHVGIVKENEIKVGDEVSASIDEVRRSQIQSNHTATHLLHWALQKTLGEHIKQAGSVVDSERLRFDFNHHKPLSSAEIRTIEDLVNEKIRENTKVNAYELSYEEAQKKKDIKQFFGDKYGKTVRVIDIDYSKELCGGTHTNAVGTIGYFRILKESSIAAGVRRIEAVSGFAAESYAREQENELQKAAELLKTQVPQVGEKVEKLIAENKDLQETIRSLKLEKLKDLTSKILKKETIKDFTLATTIAPISSSEMKDFADLAINELPSGILLLATKEADKCSLLIRVTPDLVKKGVNAGQLIKELAPIIGGSGGGKPDSAQAGGKFPDKIEECFAHARSII